MNIIFHFKEDFYNFFFTFRNLDPSDKTTTPKPTGILIIHSRFIDIFAFN